MKTICILGGNGFVGSHLAARLVKQGYQLRILSRRPQRHRALKLLPDTLVVQVNPYEPEVLREQFKGCAAVINLAGILNEHGQGDFQQVHAELPERVAQACEATGVPQLIHLSALNASTQAESAYLRSKAEGEQRIRATASQTLVSILRPSVIFGEGDSFFNRFALFLQLSPCCFPLACAKSRLAPVWVGDVVSFITALLEDKSLAGGDYDLCGPQIYRLQQLVEFTAKTLGLKRRIIPLGETLSRIQAGLLQYVPGKPFTPDNYAVLQVDSLCKENALTRLGIQTGSVEVRVPAYLVEGKARGRYQGLRQRAGR